MKVYRYGLLLAVVLACGLCWRSLPLPKMAEFRFPTFRQQRTDAQSHRIFPYSVIPGGAYSPEELARARKIDRVVARHYAGFGSSTKVQRMPADTLLYVSYRKSNQVYWTKAKHRIPKGETVLCDGDNYARTRCGNRLSSKPQSPVAPTDEPTDEAMDIPDQPKAPLVASKPFFATPDADFFVPVSPADLSRVLSPLASDAPPFTSTAAPGGSERPYNFGSSPGSSPFVGNSLAYPATGNTASGTTGGTSPGGGSIITSPADTVVTPEPGSLSLLSVGLLVSGWLIRRLRLSPISPSNRT